MVVKHKKNNNPLHFVQSYRLHEHYWTIGIIIIIEEGRYFFFFFATSLIFKTKKKEDKQLKFTCFKISSFSSYSTVLFAIGFYVPNAFLFLLFLLLLILAFIYLLYTNSRNFWLPAARCQWFLISYVCCAYLLRNEQKKSMCVCVNNVLQEQCKSF